VVANPEQVRSLLAAVAQQGPMREQLVPFFGCLYFAGMRPGEALALRAHNCILPRRGWGRLNLAESEPRAGADWTDDGSPRDARGLKPRGQREMRPVPIPPELVQLLREHIRRYEILPDGCCSGPGVVVRFRTARTRPSGGRHAWPGSHLTRPRHRWCGGRTTCGMRLSRCG
jgi:integrase